jgi:hypothetical protein
MIGKKVKNLSKICKGKEIDLIASGYNLKILPFAWLLLISGLIGVEVEIREPPQPLSFKDPIEETKKVIQKIKEGFRNYWRCFK